MTKKERKLKRCWACDFLIIRKIREYHHPLDSKDKDDLKIPLCIVCHDMVDRVSLSHLEVFIKMFTKVYHELNSMPKGKYRFTKLFMLKSIKLLNHKLNMDNASYSKQEPEKDKD